MPRTGRPSDLTPELQEAICKLIATGARFSDACMVNGVAKLTGYEWLQRGRGVHPKRKPLKRYVDFAKAVAKAIAQHRSFAHIAITSAVRGGAVVGRRETVVTAPDGTVTRQVEEKKTGPNGKLALEELRQTYPKKYPDRRSLKLGLDDKTQKSLGSLVDQIKAIHAGAVDPRLAITDGDVVDAELADETPTEGKG